jgi:hypothetical protein
MLFVPLSCITELISAKVQEIWWDLFHFILVFHLSSLSQLLRLFNKSVTYRGVSLFVVWIYCIKWFVMFVAGLWWVFQYRLVVGLFVDWISENVQWIRLSFEIIPLVTLYYECYCVVHCP